MENQDENLDLLDLGDETEEVDTLPEATPFSSPRPKRPWLLMVLGITVIILSTWIIVAKIGGDSSSKVSVDLDTPVVSADVQKEVADLKVPEKAKVEEKKTEKVAEKAAPIKEEAPVEKPVENDGTPVRVIEDRKEVTFNPDKAPVATKPAPVAKKPAAKKIIAPTTVKKASVATANGSIYVQFGSYSSRALAQTAEQKIRSSHANLFSGKQFVILAAEVKGQTTYRLRVPFHTANDANGFCRNAKSDGLDCYVTK